MGRASHPAGQEVLLGEQDNQAPWMLVLLGRLADTNKFWQPLCTKTKSGVHGGHALQARGVLYFDCFVPIRKENKERDTQDIRFTRRRDWEHKVANGTYHYLHCFFAFTNLPGLGFDVVQYITALRRSHCFAYAS